MTLKTSDTIYKSPANGFIQFTRYLKSGGIWASIVTDNGNDILCINSLNTSSTNKYLNIYLPVGKNINYKIGYDGTHTTQTYERFQFIYAEGQPSIIKY